MFITGCSATRGKVVLLSTGKSAKMDKPFNYNFDFPNQSSSEYFTVCRGRLLPLPPPLPLPHSACTILAVRSLILSHRL